MTHNLDQAKRNAQATANRSTHPCAIYNFNRFFPWYVLRDYTLGDEQRLGYVWHAIPVYEDEA